MEYETAGDPISGLKWTRKTTEKIAQELEQSRAERRKRNRQFLHIASQRKLFARKGCPIISVNTKRKNRLATISKLVSQT